MKNEILDYDSNKQPIYGRYAMLRDRESLIIVDDIESGIGYNEKIIQQIKAAGLTVEDLRVFQERVQKAFDNQKSAEALAQAMSELSAISRDLDLSLKQAKYPVNNSVNPNSRQYKRKRR